jgi:hypothetical protein
MDLSQSPTITEAMTEETWSPFNVILNWQAAVKK